MWKKAVVSSAYWLGSAQCWSNAQICSRKGGSQGWVEPWVASDCCRNPASEHAGLHDMKNTGTEMFSPPQELWRLSFQSLKLWKIRIFAFSSVFLLFFFCSYLHSLSWAAIWRPDHLTVSHELVHIQNWLCGSRWLKNWSGHCQIFLWPSWAPCPAWAATVIFCPWIAALPFHLCFTRYMAYNWSFSDIYALTRDYEVAFDILRLHGFSTVSWNCSFSSILKSLCGRENMFMIIRVITLMAEELTWEMWAIIPSSCSEPHITTSWSPFSFLGRRKHSHGYLLPPVLHFVPKTTKILVHKGICGMNSSYMGPSSLASLSKLL